MESLLQLWGKTASDGRFHPVLFHMLDVGHVAQILLSSDAPERPRRVLASALGVADPGTLVDWLPLVAALHDIGKISEPFQGQVPGQQQRLAALGFSFSPARYDQIRHQHISAVAVDTILNNLEPLRPWRTLLRDVYGGHHGQFPASLRHASKFVNYIEAPEWAALRREATDVLKAVLGLRAPSVAPPNLRAATAALTGFLILADWLGSDEDHFSPQPDLSLDDYLPLSRERARQAVASTSFLSARPRTQWNGFRSVFPDITTPRPLQEAIDQLPPAAVAWPALYVIEAPTGEGKTEAALALATRLASFGWSNELYFALPTTATSNQMFGRVYRFLNRDPDRAAPVKLIHGQALLAEDGLVTQMLGDGDDAGSPAVAAPEWFAPRKRALLAPYGVGTVDQAELSVLSARHYVLRLFGLAGKVVIIDEVHAYDAYMNTVIEHALQWFATLGTPVILLSATLPQRRHRSLARAYRAGLRGMSPDALCEEEGPDESLPYPVLSVYTAERCERLNPPAAQPDRRLTLQFITDISPVEEAERLLSLVQNGGAVARITNTVQRAQDIFAALREIAPAYVELHLLHARLPGDDRLAREGRLTERLGPESQRSPEDRIIVVGTQVLEQSLDYDVDLMVSDLAPTDLLLQRAGRLHRHPWRKRTPRFQDATLQVVVGRDEHGAPEFGPSALVYEPFILWKSWLVLRARQDDAGRITLTLPADYRPLIEATYDDRRDLFPEDQVFRAAIDAAWEDYQRRRQEMIDNARQRLIPHPEPDKAITEGARIYFEEDEDGGKQGWGMAVTRYGRESISVIPLHRVPDGVAADPDGPPLTPATCDRECQLRVLRRAIRVSNPTIVSTLPAREEPGLSWFRRTPLLRLHYPLVLDNGRTQIGNLTIRLDSELGLVIGKEDAL